MAEIRKIQIQDSNGNTYYPQTNSENIILDKSGKTLNEFFASGGTINGPTIYNSTEDNYGLKIHGRLIESMGEGLGLKAPQCEKIYYYYNTVYKKGALIPDVNGTVHLGQYDKKFCDLWIDIDIKGDKVMCTKLPNGNIL